MANLEKFNFNKLSPFKWFVLNNFPFIDADFDAMTEWQLFQKIGEWINKIIDSQNSVGSEMEKVINTFNELYNYVDNFFKNLDLQDEVNNKLNEMAEDGTLSNLLLNYANITRVYNTTMDMINDSENITISMKIKTLGYANINDLGGAEFYVRRKNENDSQDNGSIYFIHDDLVIELIETPTLNVEVFGIFGNTISNDETSKIQSIFNYVRNKKIKIIFGKEKTYILHSPIDIGEFSIIEGNNSTLLIDSIIDDIDSYQFIKDNGLNGDITLIDWKNININITADTLLLDKTDVLDTRPYSIFETSRTKTFKMSGCSIKYSGNERNQITFFKFKGHGKIFINNCYFENNHRAIFGSSLWIQSTHSNEIYYARIKNSTFYDTCRDETISIYNPNGHDIVFENCKILKEYYNTYYPEDSTSYDMINPQRFLITDIHSYKTDTNTITDSHYSTFMNCTLRCTPKEPENDDVVPEIYFLAGHNDINSYDFLKFENCKITCIGVKSIGYGGYNKTIKNIIDYHNNELLKFINCEMFFDITDLYGLIMPACWNLFIDNCILNLNKFFYNCYWQKTDTGSSPNIININNSRIIMKNLSNDSIIFHTTPEAHQNFKITNNDFICLDSNNSEVTPTLHKDYETNNGFTSENVFLYDESENVFYESNNRINYK